jgi:transposase InsO family protein
MSRDNPLWGTERIRGELLKLDIVVSNRSIRRYRWRRPSPVGTQRWRTFLQNEMTGIWAADMFTVQTVRFRTLYVLFFITHARRELVQLNVTSSPNAAWIWQQVVNATPWGQHPAYLIHDRDGSYGRDFDLKLGHLGIAGVKTPARAPKANSIAERLVRTIRQECLDHVIVVNETHLRRLLSELMSYYNYDRPHRTLRMDTPVHNLEMARDGPVDSRAVLGGLHHVYRRAA